MIPKMKNKVEAIKQLCSGLSKDEMNDVIKYLQKLVAQGELPHICIRLSAHVFYPQDAHIGIDGEWTQVNQDGTPKMPCLEPDDEGAWMWNLIIDPRVGKVVNWPVNWDSDIEAKVHYKVCDECCIEFLVGGKYRCNNDCHSGYVPDFLAIDKEGYGDYIIITIDKDGYIKNWSVSAFNEWLDLALKFANQKHMEI